jgi:uncharacterized protein
MADPPPCRIAPKPGCVFSRPSRFRRPTLRLAEAAGAPTIDRAGRAVADIYLNACCFIYLVEGEPSWRSRVEERVRALEPATGLVTSQLSRLECRMRPVKDNDSALLERYDALFGASRVTVLDVTEAVIDRATSLRAQHGFKSPDAIRASRSDHTEPRAGRPHAKRRQSRMVLPQAPAQSSPIAW